MALLDFHVCLRDGIRSHFCFFWLSGGVFFHNLVRGVKARPVAEPSQLELDVLGDKVGDGACAAGSSVPPVHTLPDVAVLVDPALFR